MKLIEINWRPTERHLRQFGLICMFALPFLGWLWSAGQQTIILLGGVGIVLALFGVTLPKLLTPIFISLMLVTLPIGFVISEVMLASIYFGMFLPIGIYFRIVKRDALKRTLDPGQKSYWEKKSQPDEVARYYRQW